MHDVLIVGSGPAGSHLALRLAAQGYDVVVIERNSSVGEAVICSGIIGCEAFEKFDLPQTRILGEIKDIDFFGPRGDSFSYKSDQVLAKVVCRKSFDSALAEKAKGAGAHYLFDTPVKEVQAESDSVRLVAEATPVAECEGGELTFRARYCAIATGYGSPLPRTLGCGVPQDLLQAAQIEVPISSFSSRIEIYLGQDLAPGSFAWFVPLSNGYARIGLTVPRMAYYYLMKLLKNPRIQERILPHDSKVKSCYLPCGLIEKPYSGRVVIVGEAAGQVKSTTGGGIYYALLCADMASQAFDQALQGKMPFLKAFQAYERDVHSLLHREISVGKFLRKIYSKMNDGQIHRLLSLLNSKFFPTSTLLGAVHFDWHIPFIESALIPIFEPFMNTKE